tara:strand:- start:5877 stop:6134 length:258 start_codon:yes stop_codon:yes gene_type:complete
MGLPIDEDTLFQANNALKADKPGFTQCSYKRSFKFSNLADVNDLMDMVNIANRQRACDLYYGNLSATQLVALEKLLNERKKVVDS